MIQVGETIRIGYFPQEEQKIDGRQRVIDYVKEIGEYIVTTEGRISASQLLERFLFTPDMQYSPVEKLSGGERRRLYLLGILVRNPNVLLLDECSDSLDIPTLAVLEDYLNSFTGIVVTVSHDRYFLDNVADRILSWTGRAVCASMRAAIPIIWKQGEGILLMDRKKRSAGQQRAERG